MDDQPNAMAEDSMAHGSTADDPTVEIEIATVTSATRNESAPTLTEMAETEIASEETAPAEAVSCEAATSEASTSEAVPAATHRVSKKLDRPFRVKLRGSVLVLVRLPNKRDIRAAFHQLSITGGVVHLEKPLDEKLGVEMIFHIGGATLREKAQMLFPMWATQGWMQPFRFVDMNDASREALDAHLKEFMGEPAKAKGASAGA